MDNCSRQSQDHQEIPFSFAIGWAIAALALLGWLAPNPLWAQSTGTEAGASSAAPQKPAQEKWELAAGGAATFGSATVKLAAPGEPEIANMPLGPGDVFSPTKGVFTAKSVLLIEYLLFAYKLAATPAQVQSVRSQLPAWANQNRYDIDGLAADNSTKDQFRLMMQALLADRFKLALHLESRQLPVYGLVLETSGKTGPKLRPHRNLPPCPATPPSPLRSAFNGDFPFSCGGVISEPKQAAMREHLGGRRVTMAQIAASLGGTPSADLNRPVFDQTGLSGNFDFSLDFTPGLNGTPPGFEHLKSELPFEDALKQQLGLKLVPEKGSVDFLFIDHLERPPAN